jgi:hypothetical protein
MDARASARAPEREVVVLRSMPPIAVVAGRAAAMAMPAAAHPIE